MATTARTLCAGKRVSFVQTGRQIRTWNEKHRRHERQPGAPREISGIVTALSLGRRTVQISVRTDNGKGITAHLPSHYIIPDQADNPEPDTA